MPHADCGDHLVPRDDRRPNILGSSLPIDTCANASLTPRAFAQAVLNDVRPLAAGAALAKAVADAFGAAAAAITIGAAVSR